MRKVTRIAVKNFRIQSLIIDFENTKLLLFNTYFQTDSQNLNLNDNEANELHKMLTDISRVITEKKDKLNKIRIRKM